MTGMIDTSSADDDLIIRASCRDSMRNPPYYPPHPDLTSKLHSLQLVFGLVIKSRVAQSSVVNLGAANGVHDVVDAIEAESFAPVLLPSDCLLVGAVGARDLSLVLVDVVRVERPSPASTDWAVDTEWMMRSGCSRYRQVNL